MCLSTVTNNYMLIACMYEAESNCMHACLQQIPKDVYVTQRYIVPSVCSTFSLSL